MRDDATLRLRLRRQLAPRLLWVPCLAWPRRLCAPVLVAVDAPVAADGAGHDLLWGAAACSRGSGARAANCCGFAAAYLFRVALATAGGLPMARVGGVLPHGGVLCSLSGGAPPHVPSRASGPGGPAGDVKVTPLAKCPPVGRPSVYSGALGRCAPFHPNSVRRQMHCAWLSGTCIRIPQPYHSCCPSGVMHCHPPLAYFGIVG